MGDIRLTDIAYRWRVLERRERPQGRPALRLCAQGEFEKPLEVIRAFSVDSTPCKSVEDGIQRVGLSREHGIGPLQVAAAARTGLFLQRSDQAVHV